MGYSIHVLRISRRGSEDNIYDKYYRGLESSISQDNKKQAVIYERRQLTQNFVFGVEKHCVTLDGNLSKLGYGIQSTFDNVCGQRDRIIGFPLLIFFPWAETVFTPAARIPSLPTGTMQLRGNPKSCLLRKPPFA